MTPGGKWNFDFILTGFSSSTDSSAVNGSPDETDAQWDFAIDRATIENSNLKYVDRTIQDSIYFDISLLELEMDDFSVFGLATGLGKFSGC